MDAVILARIGMEFINVAMRFMLRGERDVPPEEVEQAKSRGKRARDDMYESLDAADEREDGG